MEFQGQRGIFKIILLVFILITTYKTNAQQKDSVYYVQFVSEEDGMGLAFTTVEISGIRIIWTANADGLVKIKSGELTKYKNKLSAKNVDFKPTFFFSDTLQLNKTVVIHLEKNPVQLDIMEIISHT